MICADCGDKINEEPPGVFECACGTAFTLAKVGMFGSIELFRPLLPEPEPA